MVVASSNNKAVENVSAELPSPSAIANDAQELRYFKTLSDAMHQSDTGGAIAAVLGNMQNRSPFKQVFWWDDDNGLSNYLRAATGLARDVEITDPETGHVGHRTPRIVEKEQPPSSREEALKRWRSTRNDPESVGRKPPPANMVGEPLRRVKTIACVGSGGSENQSAM